MLKSTSRAVLSKLSIPLWLGILLSASVPVLAAQQHRANSEAAAIGPAQTQATINVAPTSMTISEPDEEEIFVIWVDNDPLGDINIPLTATSDECTISPSSSIVLNSGNWEGVDVFVTAANDDVEDGPQSCDVEVGPASSAIPEYDGVDPEDVSVTVNDDDTAGFQVTPTSGLTVVEGGATDTFDVSLTSEPLVDVNVNLSSGAECTAAPTPLTFTPGNWNSPQAVTVSAVDDDVVDGTQSCTVTGSASASGDGNYHGASMPSVSVDVQDNDSAGIQVSPTTGLLVTEGGASDTFNIKLNSEPTDVVSIGLTTGSECSVSTSPVELHSGNWSGGVNVTVTAVDDDVVDGQQTCTVTTASATSNDTDYDGINPPNVTVTVDDNDSATVSFLDPAPAGVSVNEAAGSIVLTVELSNESTSDVTVDYATGGGTATAGQDYTAQSGTLTINAHTMSGTISVPILDDALYEGNETFNVTLGSPSGASLAAPSQMTVTIIDGETVPTVQFSSGAYSEDEGAGNAEITVTLSHPAASDVTVTANTTGSGSATAGSDYTAVVDQLVTIPATQLSGTFDVPIINDNTDEPNETVGLALSNPSANADLGLQTLATLTITDNDLPPSVSFDRDSYSVEEGNGTRQVTVELSAASGLTVTVDYTTSDGSAAAGSDYTATSGTLTFAPGDMLETFDVPIIDDDMDEPLESLNVDLSAPNNAQNGTFMSADIIITDDDPTPTVEFHDAPYRVNEGDGSATITVVLSNPAKFPISVDYATSDGTATAGADYTARDSTLVFTSGVITRTFTVPIIDDVVDETEETLNLALSNPQGATLGTANTTLTIDDNDGATEIRFASATYSVTESVVTATIDVIRSGTSGFPVSVNYATISGGSATPGQDYTAVSGMLEFEANETLKSFSVPILSDAINEPPETVNLELSNPVGALPGDPSTAVLTIHDSNETPAVQFSQDTYTVDESMLTADITVTLSIAKAQDVTVFYGVQEGTATLGEDFATTGGALTIPAGATAATFTVSLLPDQIDEPDETVILSINGAEGADLGERTSASLVILDNDPTPTLSFSLSSLIVGETDGTADLPVRLSAESGRTVTVDYRTVSGSAIPGSDYVHTSGTLTFAPGDTNKMINVTLLEGLGGEPNETFTVELSAPTNATLATPDTATVTIVDGDLVRYTRFFPLAPYFSLGEPNNSCPQAYEIMLFQSYLFAPDDESDWYFFTLTEPGHLIVEVNNFTPSDGQLALLKTADCTTANYLDRIVSPDTSNTLDGGVVEPGRYYIFVGSGEDPTFEPYQLRVRLEAE